MLLWIRPLYPAALLGWKIWSLDTFTDSAPLWYTKKENRVCRRLFTRCYFRFHWCARSITCSHTNAISVHKEEKKTRVLMQHSHENWEEQTLQMLQQNFPLDPLNWLSGFTYFIITSESFTPWFLPFVNKFVRVHWVWQLSFWTCLITYGLP